MGDKVHLQDAVCCSGNVVTDAYYETLYPIIKEEEEYTNIMPLSVKTADVFKKENKHIDKAYVSPKAISDDATLRRLKILFIVLMIINIISTGAISAFIHLLLLTPIKRTITLDSLLKMMRRADATDHQLVQVQRTTQFEQGRTEDQVLVQTMNASIIQLKLDQRYDRVRIQLLNSSNEGLQMKTEDLNTKILFLDAQIADINATYKAQDTRLETIEAEINATYKAQDTRLKSIEDGLQMKIGDLNTQILFLDAQVAEMNATYKAQDTRLETVEDGLRMKTEDLNTQILFLNAQVAEINFTYKAQDTRFKSIEDGLQMKTEDLNTQILFLNSQVAEINSTYNAHNSRLETIEGLQYTIEDGHQMKIEKMNTQIVFFGAQVAEINSTYKAQDTRLKSIEDGFQMKIEKMNTKILLLNAQVAEINATYQAQDTRLANVEASDCQDILQRGFQTSGVYIIRPRGTAKNISIYCDMNSAGEAWTVIQKRYDGSVDFNNSWIEYKQGFGSPHSEFWIGNEVIHKLSSQGNYILKVILRDWNDTTKFAVYNKFHVTGEYDKYRIAIDGYSGDAGNAMRYHNGMKFSTFDNDNDRYSGNCAVIYRGGWWFNNCYHAQLNGQYLSGSKDSSSIGIRWYQWHGYYYSLKATQMMIRKI